MRTLSSNLTSAQEKPYRKPKVTGSIYDDKIRFEKWDITYTAMKLTRTIESNGKIITAGIATYDATQALLVGTDLLKLRIVSDATVASQWNVWTTIWTAPATYYIISLDIVPHISTADRLDAFVIVKTGAGTTRIYRIVSTDNGATWDAGTLIKTITVAYTDAYWLAALNNTEKVYYIPMNISGVDLAFKYTAFDGTGSTTWDHYWFGRPFQACLDFVSYKLDGNNKYFMAWLAYYEGTIGIFTSTSTNGTSWSRPIMVHSLEDYTFEFPYSDNPEYLADNLRLTYTNGVYFITFEKRLGIQGHYEYYAIQSTDFVNWTSPIFIDEYMSSTLDTIDNQYINDYSDEAVNLYRGIEIIKSGLYYYAIGGGKIGRALVASRTLDISSDIVSYSIDESVGNASTLDLTLRNEKGQFQGSWFNDYFDYPSVNSIRKWNGSAILKDNTVTNYLNLTGTSRTAYATILHNKLFTDLFLQAKIQSILTKFLISDCESATGWSTVNGAVSLDTTNVKIGSGSIAFTKTSTGKMDGGASYSLATTDLSSYYATTYWIKTPTDMTNVLYLRLMFGLSNGDFNYLDIPKTSIPTAATWYKLASKMSDFLYSSNVIFPQMLAGANTLYLSSNSNDVDAGQDGSNQCLVSAKIGASTVLASTAVKVGIHNGDFESAPPFTAATNGVSYQWIDGTAAGSATDSRWGWRIYRTAASFEAKFDSAVVHSGNYSMKLSCTDVTGRGTVFTSDSTVPNQLFTMKPSTAYKFSCWCKTNNVAANAVFVDVREYTATPVGTQTNTSTKFTGTNDWFQITMYFTSAATTALFDIVLRNNVAGNISDAWFDDLKLEEVVSITNSGSAAPLLPIFTGVTTSDTADQYQLISNDIIQFGQSTTGKQKYAQSFIAQKKHLTNVIFRRNTGGGTFTGTVSISIRADSAGTPAASSLISAPLTNAQWEAIPNNTDYVFTLIPAQLTPGNLYWIVFESSTLDDTNFPQLRRWNGGHGTSGTGARYNGAAWSNDAFSIYFQTIYAKTSQIPTITTPSAQGTMLGQELVVNGNFDTNVTGWTATRSTLTWDAGRAKIVVTAGQSDGYMTFTNILTNKNAKFRVSVDYQLGVGGGWIRIQRDGSTDIVAPLISGTGTYTADVTNIGANMRIVLYQTGDGQTGYFDNVSIKEYVGASLTVPYDSDGMLPGAVLDMGAGTYTWKGVPPTQYNVISSVAYETNSVRAWEGSNYYINGTIGPASTKYVTIKVNTYFPITSLTIVGEIYKNGKGRLEISTNNLTWSTLIAEETWGTPSYREDTVVTTLANGYSVFYLRFIGIGATSYMRLYLISGKSIVTATVDTSRCLTTPKFTAINNFQARLLMGTVANTFTGANLDQIELADYIGINQGIVFNATDANNCHRFVIKDYATLALQKVVSGVITELATYALNTSLNPIVYLSVRQVGNLKVCYANAGVGEITFDLDSSAINNSDATFSSGYCGVTNIDCNTKVYDFLAYDAINNKSYREDFGAYLEDSVPLRFSKTNAVTLITASTPNDDNNITMYFHPELITNGGFESGLSNWSKYDGETTALTGGAITYLTDDTIKKSGNTSLKFSNSATADYWFISQTLKIIPNMPYKISGWLKCQNVVVGYKGNIYYQFYTSGLVETGANTLIGAVYGATDWTLVSGTATAPSDANYLMIQIRGGASGDAGANPGLTWADDIKVSLQTKKEQSVDILSLDAFDNFQAESIMKPVFTTSPINECDSTADWGVYNGSAVALDTVDFKESTASITTTKGGVASRSCDLYYTYASTSNWSPWLNYFLRFWIKTPSTTALLNTIQMYRFQIYFAGTTNCLTWHISTKGWVANTWYRVVIDLRRFDATSGAFAPDWTQVKRFILNTYTVANTDYPEIKVDMFEFVSRRGYEEGMVFRGTDSDNCYRLVAKNPNTLALQKVVSGLITELGTYAYDMMISQNYYFGIKASGSSIKGYIGTASFNFLTDTPAISATDTTYTTGKIGFWNNSCDTTIYLLDISQRYDTTALTLASKILLSHGLYLTPTTTEVIQKGIYYIDSITQSVDADSSTLNISARDAWKPLKELTAERQTNYSTPYIKEGISLEEVDVISGNWADDSTYGGIVNNVAPNSTGIVLTKSVRLSNYTAIAKVMCTAAIDIAIIFNAYDANNFYMLRILKNPAESIDLYKCVARTFTLISTSAISLSVGSWYSLKVVVEDGYFRSYYAGYDAFGLIDSYTNVFNTYDTSLAALTNNYPNLGGYCGIRNNNGGATTTTHYCSNITITENRTFFTGEEIIQRMAGKAGITSFVFPRIIDDVWNSIDPLLWTTVSGYWTTGLNKLQCLGTSIITTTGTYNTGYAFGNFCLRVEDIFAGGGVTPTGIIFKYQDANNYLYLDIGVGGVISIVKKTDSPAVKTTVLATLNRYVTGEITLVSYNGYIYLQVGSDCVVAYDSQFDTGLVGFICTKAGGAFIDPQMQVGRVKITEFKTPIGLIVDAGNDFASVIQKIASTIYAEAFFRYDNSLVVKIPNDSTSMYTYQRQLLGSEYTQTEADMINTVNLNGSQWQDYENRKLNRYNKFVTSTEETITDSQYSAYRQIISQKIRRNQPDFVPWLTLQAELFDVIKINDPATNLMNRVLRIWNINYSYDAEGTFDMDIGIGDVV